MNYVLDHLPAMLSTMVAAIAVCMTWLNGQKLQANKGANLENRMVALEDWHERKSIDRVDLERVKDIADSNTRRLTILDGKFEAFANTTQAVEKALIRLEGKIENAAILNNLVAVDTKRRLDELQASVSKLTDRDG